MKNKKTIITVILIILFLCVFLFLLNFCSNPLGVENRINNNILDTIIETRDGGDFFESLSINLETLMDEECIVEHEGCVEGCFGVMGFCEDDFMTCSDVCEDDFPITDEIEECWDTCDDEEMVCEDDCIVLDLSSGNDVVNFFSIIPVAYAIAPMDEELITECEDDCWRDSLDCDYECDIDYIECEYDCADEYVSPCTEVAMDCIYECLTPCISGTETVELSGGAISDVGNFFETSFPQFTEQIDTYCGWMGGDFVSAPNKFGCENIFFIAGWFSPFLESAESMGVVCGQIGGTYSDDNEIMCRI